ncbi:MAG TPA: MEDS domain-containing protein, partial [Chloroflexota bacterium]|nr:MEDS domain-containing protein [Chloroflexota bacterium]
MPLRHALGTIAALAPGDHVCFIYDDPATALALAAQVLARGLARNGYAIYVAGEHPTERVDAALASQGVDVARERQRDALLIRSTWQEVFPTGEVAPEAMATFIATLIDQARARGFSEIWAVTDLTGAMRINVPHEHFTRYEALLYQAFTQNPIVGICTYNRQSLPPAELRR